VEVNARLADGRFLRGTAPGVRGDVLGTVTYSRVNPRHRLAAWVRLLALTASHPQRDFEAVTIGRARAGADDRARVTVARILVPGANPDERRERATAALARLIDVYDRGLREALPIACMTSAAYAAAARSATSPVAAARKAWESTWAFDREDREPDHLLVLGGERTIEEVLFERPRADEQGDGWHAADETRFGRYARRVWDDLLAVEKVVDR
jgi:exodeoxyribonuclease V gamma subunit